MDGSTGFPLLLSELDIDNDELELENGDKDDVPASSGEMIDLLQLTDGKITNANDGIVLANAGNGTRVDKSVLTFH